MNAEVRMAPGQQQTEAERFDQLLEFYSFMVQAFSLISRSDNIGQLYQDICRLGVRLDRRLVLAWIGVTVTGSDVIKVAASAGPASAYLDHISVLSTATDARGMGPAGRALREGHSIIANHFLDDPATAPWQTRARESGIASCVAVPLRHGQDIFGALMLYGSEPDMFDERMVSELDVLSQALSTAIERITAREAGRSLTAKLKESQLTLRAVLDATLQTVVMIKADGEVLAINRKGAESLGCSPQEAVGRNIFDLLPSESMAGRRRIVEQVLQVGQPAAMEDESNGHTFRSTYYPLIERDPRVVIYAEDITAIRQAEQAAREVDRKFREVVNLASEGILSLDLEGVITFANPRLHALLAVPAGELPGRSALAFVAAGNREDFIARLQRARAGGRIGEAQVAYNLRRDDGMEFPALVSAALKTGSDGTAEGLVVVVTDISELRRVETELRNALRVVEASPVVCFRWRAVEGWPVEFVSPNVNRWGWEAEDLLAGKPTFTELVHPEDLPQVSEEVSRHTASGAVEYVQEYRLRAADGHYFWVEDSTRVLRDADGTALFYEGVLTDVDAVKRREQDLAASLEAQRALNRKLENAQNQLLQAEKMASIGQLAAGVAHEINNPIGFVTSNMGTLGTYLGELFAIVDAAEAAEAGTSHPEDFAAVRAARAACDFNFLRQDIGQLLNETREGLERVRKIVQDLKDFSRVGEVAWQWADLHQGLDATLNIVRNEIKYHCTIVKHYGTLPQVYCLPPQLNQVFMNLLLNAGQAIEGKGEITISTEAVGDDAVRISIADTGRGIPPEHLNRIFDPFFTTKPVGQGTGLGLSLAWGIVRRHGGCIEVSSTPGHGSTFTITLPVRPAESGSLEEPTQ